MGCNQLPKSLLVRAYTYICHHFIFNLLYMKLVFLFLLLCSFAFPSIAQDQIEHLWYNEAKTSKIQIYKAVDGNYYGKIVWLKEPNKDGHPKVDDNNPKEAQRGKPLLNLIIMKKFKKDEDDTYTNGTIYDPKNGKTYDCIITFKGDHLRVHGYVLGMTWLGRTEIFYKTD